MTGQELKVFTESLLDGVTMEETFFYQLVNIAKTKIEAERPWRQMIAQDSSNSVGTGNTFLTEHDLPSRYIEIAKACLIDSNNNPVWLGEIPFEMKYIQKDSPRRFYVDEANGKIYLTGTINTSYTLILYYKKETADITEIIAWEFPSRFHGALGFVVAEMQKAGVDYDTVNARQAVQNRADGRALWDAMIDWDSKLKLNSMGGMYSGQNVGFDADGLPVPDGYDFPLGLM